jgi:HSP90 family molecular chaperone
MVADRVEVVSRRAGGDTAARWSSDGLGTFTVGAADPAEAGKLMDHAAYEAFLKTDGSH